MQTQQAQNETRRFNAVTTVLVTTTSLFVAGLYYGVYQAVQNYAVF